MYRQLHPRIFWVRRRFEVKIGQFQSNVYVFFPKFHSFRCVMTRDPVNYTMIFKISGESLIFSFPV